jgi:hypothetical protein
VNSDAGTVGRSRRRDDGPLALGQMLGERYRVLEQLGRGGMGVVYRVRDVHVGADVALKVVAAAADDPARIEALRAEVRLARKVTHPNVCRIHDLERSDDLWFVTMEHVDGESLAARLARGERFAPDAVRRIVIDVGRGLAAIHAAGVIHRDIKPANVLLDASTGRAIVADFGVAVPVDAADHAIAGTRGFMAPEQAAGGPVDDRADVYALGILARELVADGTGDGAVATAPGGAIASPPEVAVAGADPALATFIARCTTEDPAARPPLAIALALLERPRRRRRGAIAAIAVVVVAVAGVLAVGALREPAPAGAAGTAAPAPARPGTVRIAGFDATGLGDSERWLADALAARVRDELDDAWAIEPSDPGAIVVGGVLTRDPAGRLALALALPGAAPPTLHGTIDELAEAVAAEIAGRVPVAERHPDQADLDAFGTRDPEVWRLVRRAQRHARMIRWHSAREVARAAYDRDPQCPVCALEVIANFDEGDTHALALYDRATSLPGGAPHWRRIIDLGVRQARDGLASIRDELPALIAMPMPDRDRRWLLARLAYRQYDAGAVADALAALERIADQWPRDAAAFKYLADHHLASDHPDAGAIALRWAEAAVANAPYDLGSRTLLARAYARLGRFDDARSEAARIEHADPDAKREVGRQLFMLHMALDQPELAEVDVRRLTTGSPLERAQAARFLGALELYRGRFAAGLDQIASAAEAYDTEGRETRGTEARLDGAVEAFALGEPARARALLAPLASTPAAGALLAIADRRAAEADAFAARATAAPGHGGLAIVVDVALGRDDRAIERYRALGGEVGIDALADVAAAFDRRGDDAIAADVLGRLVAHPHAWRRMVAVVRAHLRLGELAELRGDGASARAAFQRVLACWGRGAPEAPEVRAARAALARLP